MPQGQPVQLNGIQFFVQTDRNGFPRVTVGERPSQSSDAGQLMMATWRVDGHDFNSFENISPSAEAGFLGRDYGANTDGRWLGVDTLGPRVQTTTLSTYDQGIGIGRPGPAGADDGIPQNSGNLLGSTFLLGPMEVVASASNGLGGAYGMSIITANGTTYGYVLRGSRPAKVDLSDFTLKDAGLVLDAPATDSIETAPQDITVGAEVSIGIGETLPYTTLQTSNVGAPPTTDTWRNNSDSEPAEIFGAAPDRTILLSGQSIKGNIQTGAVTMYNPTWNTINSNLPGGVKPTGFVMDGNLYLIMTSDGPYMLDANTREFFPVIPELDNDDQNGLQTDTWFPVGAIMPLHYSLRYQRFGAGSSFGPETFAANTSPVQGQPTGVAGSPRELFTTQYNPQTGNSYLIAWYTRDAVDDRFTIQHSSLLSPFVIAEFSSKQSRFLRWLGTVNSLRTLPTLAGGYGSDMFHIDCGRTSRWIDDSSYTYASSGTTYLTEMRRQPGLLKDIEFIEFECGGTMDASKTVTVGIAINGGSYVDFTAVTSTGSKRQYAVDGSGVPLTTLQGANRLKPRIAYATNSTTAAPQVLGTLRVHYRTRPTMIRVLTYTFELYGTNSRTPEEMEEALRSMVYSGPVEFQDIERDTYYVRVRDVGAAAYQPTAADSVSASDVVRTVQVTLETWSVS